MTSETSIARFRTVLLGLVGLCCLVYALLSLAQTKPDPVLWYLPWGAGLIATILIFAVFLRADKATRKAASDELYKATMRKAASYAYWVAVGMYPLFFLCVKAFGLNWDTVFAVMGTLTGASYLLILTYLEWQSG